MMSLMRKTVLACAIVALAIASVGCAKKAEPEVKMVPKVAPPAIAKAGTLVVGVNLNQAPYAAKVAGEYVGMDVEIAKALATKLGLECDFVDVAPDKVAQALKDRKVDVVMSADTTAKDILVAGEYGQYGSGIFANAPLEQPLTGVTVKDFPIAVQERSPARWYFLHRYGKHSTMTFPTIAEAIEAAEMDAGLLVAGDTSVIRYAIVEGAKLTQVGVVEEPVPAGVVVASENVDLAQAIAVQLKAFTDSGAMGSVSRKWLGTTPEITP